MKTVQVIIEVDVTNKDAKKMLKHGVGLERPDAFSGITLCGKPFKFVEAVVKEEV